MNDYDDEKVCIYDELCHLYSNMSIMNSNGTISHRADISRDYWDWDY